MPKFRLDSGSKFLGSARLGLGICRLGSAQARKFQARSTSICSFSLFLSFIIVDRPRAEESLPFSTSKLFSLTVFESYPRKGEEGMQCMRLLDKEAAWHITFNFQKSFLQPRNTKPKIFTMGIFCSSVITVYETDSNKPYLNRYRGELP